MELLFSTRLSERLEAAAVSVSSAQAGLLGQYYALLERWNERINLTGLPLRDYPAQALDRLLVEPVVAAGCIEASSSNWVDLGSGGGSPAIPLKILRPELTLTMVEGRARKCAFLREAMRHLRLEQGCVVCARFEDLDERVPSESADLITLRAVRVDGVVSRLLVRLLTPTGSVMIFGGGEDAIPGFVNSRRDVLPGGSRLLTFRRRGGS